MTELSKLVSDSMLPRADALVAFFQQGGPVLWVLAIVAALCWLLIVERILYIFSVFPHYRQNIVEQWQARSDKSSWYASAVRERWLNDAEQHLFRHLRLMRGLVAVCPMMGLLGTVTGMITVFDAMAVDRVADPKSMAHGISMATLPTLAGMVIALAGLFAHARLQKLAQRQVLTLSQAMRGR